MGNVVPFRRANTESFFRVFEYGHLMHDAIDGGLVYEIIIISRDLATASGITLKKGTEYHEVWFLFEKLVFQFIDWIPNLKNPSEYIPDPETFIEIPQAELAPFLHWNESP